MTEFLLYEKNVIHAPEIIKSNEVVIEPKSIRRLTKFAFEAYHVIPYHTIL